MLRIKPDKLKMFIENCRTDDHWDMLKMFIETITTAKTLTDLGYCVTAPLHILTKLEELNHG